MSEATSIAAQNWLDRLRDAWLDADAQGAQALFEHTREYYERPFKATTDRAEIHAFWKDLPSFADTSFEYDIVAVEGARCVAHYTNGFSIPSAGLAYLVDGVYILEFDDEGRCVVFRQWWFAQESGADA